MVVVLVGRVVVGSGGGGAGNLSVCAVRCIHKKYVVGAREGRGAFLVGYLIGSSIYPMQLLVKGLGRERDKGGVDGDGEERGVVSAHTRTCTLSYAPVVPSRSGSFVKLRGREGERERLRE